MKSRLMMFTFLNLLNLVASQAEEKSKVFILDEALRQAVRNSSEIKSVKQSYLAADSKVNSTNAKRWPKLSLDANYHTQSVIPEAQIGVNSIKLTDDHSYSIGPTLSFVLWDSGRLKDLEESAKYQALAIKNQEQFLQAQVALKTKISYIQTVLALDLLSNAEQAVHLSKTQNKDIRSKYKLGAVSKIDALSSDTEVNTYEMKMHQAHSDYQTRLTDLEFLTGMSGLENLSLENIETISQKLELDKEKQINSREHPLIQLQQSKEKSMEAKLSSTKSEYWPVVNLQLRSSLDYPNGPKLEQINQNSINVNFSWPLYEFGASKNEIKSQQAEILSLKENTEDIKNSLEKDFKSTKDRISSFRTQIEDLKKILKNQEELSKLNYSAYKIGKLNFSEVQTANLKLLDAKNKLSVLRAQYLSQIFTLDYLLERGTL